MAAVNTSELRRLIGVIKERKAAIGRCPSAHDYAVWKSHQRKYCDLVDSLVREEGARYRKRNGDVAHLTLAGVSTTCTGGEAQLLQNWITAAKRRLEKEAA